MNYTFSKSLDNLGGVQNSASTYQTSFNPTLEYGPSLFDRTHVFNAIFNYDLPAGRGTNSTLGTSSIRLSKGGTPRASSAQPAESLEAYLPVRRVVLG